MSVEEGGAVVTFVPQSSPSYPYGHVQSPVKVLHTSKPLHSKKREETLVNYSITLMQVGIAKKSKNHA